MKRANDHLHQLPRQIRLIFQFAPAGQFAKGSIHRLLSGLGGLVQQVRRRREFRPRPNRRFIPHHLRRRLPVGQTKFRPAEPAAILQFVRPHRRLRQRIIKFQFTLRPFFLRPQIYNRLDHIDRRRIGRRRRAADLADDRSRFRQ